MPRKCLICGHPNKIDAERQYFQGKSVNSIARQYGMNTESLRNHIKEHTSRQMVQAYRKKQEISSLDILSEIDALVDRTKKILSRAEDNKEDLTALRAINELRGTYELMLKIAVALHETRRDELAAETKEAQEEEQKERFKEMKELFTDEELSVYRSLNIKLLSGNKHSDALSEFRENQPKIKPSPQQSSSELRKDTSEGEKTPETQAKLHRTKFNPKSYQEESEDPDYPPQVRPIPATEIPHSDLKGKELIAHVQAGKRIRFK